MGERKQGLPKELVSHCKTKEEKDAFIQQVTSALPLLGKYAEIIKKKIRAHEITREIDYDCPAWSHKQADTNGYIRAMKEILKLIPTTNQEK